MQIRQREGVACIGAGGDFAMDVVLIMEFVVNAVLIIVALLLMASAIWGVSRKS